jgi:hypothetical protein
MIETVRIGSRAETKNSWAVIHPGLRLFREKVKPLGNLSR